MPLSHMKSVLVVSYSDDFRNVMSNALDKVGASSIACTTFLEAETLARKGLYNGVLVDIPSMVKAKGEEKIISCSMGNFYPMLRVRVVGPMIIPMTLSGGASQDKSLQDFLLKTCSGFKPRRLREHKRHVYHTPVIIKHKKSESRSYSMDFSWGGAFIFDSAPERFTVGDDILVECPLLNISILGVIARISLWGTPHKSSGIGIRWKSLNGSDSEAISKALKTSINHDFDRVVG